MNSDWGVAAADESQELKAQNCREASVLEEIYPCPSSIPLNPSVATDAYDGHLDDALVATIPLIPIEEEEEEEEKEEEKEAAAAHIAAAPEASMAAPPEVSMAAPSEASMELQGLHLPQATLEAAHCDTPLNVRPASLELPANVKPDITTKPAIGADAAAAAAAAYTAILKCKEQGSLIDSDLLISILSNPELIKKLIVDHGFSEDVLKEVTSSTLDRGSKKSCDVGEPSSSGYGPLSQPKMVTGTDKPSLPADQVGFVAPFAWTPSAPFKRSRSDEMMINDLINKLSGSTDTEVKPVVESTSLLNLKPDVLECRRLISQFGYDTQGQPVVVSDPKTAGPSPRPDVSKACLHLVPQNIDHNAPSMALGAGRCPTTRLQIPNFNFNMVPMAVTVGTGSPLRPRFASSSLQMGPAQNACPNGPLITMTAATSPSPRPDNSKSSFPCLPPQSVHPKVPFVAMTTRTGPLQRPKFPSPSLQLGHAQNACSNGPLMAMTAATVQSPRPDIPKSSFPCVPPPSFHPNPPVTMAARTGTSPRPNISSLHSIPHNVPQAPPSMAINGPSTKYMEYFKSLIRNHGNGQESPKFDHVEVGMSHNHQSIGQQPKFEKPHCKYFSMPRGCRNGPNCQFKHVAESLPNAGRLFQEARDSKRVKFRGEFGSKK